MTHAVHRMGDPASLAHDFHLLGMVSKKAEIPDAVDKLKEFLRIVHRAGAVNIGVSRQGSLFHKSLNELEEALASDSLIHATFDSGEKLRHAVEEVKKADLGISVTAQGLFNKIEQCCQKSGLSFHTVALSLGVIGPPEMIPEPEVLALSTMCGHGFVSFNLARKALEDVASQRRDVDDVCRELARPCLCGLFNPALAREILLSRKKE